jgi:hypothetical protein
LLTRILNPNGNYVTLSSEIVTFLKRSEKARIAEALSRDWCYPSRRHWENNQTKYLLPDNRPFWFER